MMTFKPEEMMLGKTMFQYGNAIPRTFEFLSDKDKENWGIEAKKFLRMLKDNGFRLQAVDVEEPEAAEIIEFKPKKKVVPLSKEPA